MAGDFDFGLTVEQEQRAQRLHGEALTIDMVSMGPGGAHVWDRLPADEIASRVPETMAPSALFSRAMELPWALSAEGGSDALRDFCAGHTGSSFAMAGVDSDSLRPLTRMRKYIDEISWAEMALKAEDFRRCHREGRYATYAFAQPTLNGLGRDLGVYREARELGCRMVMLTYNNQDYVGAGCTERTNAGLTNLGKRLVDHLNKESILVDVSHSGKQTTLDACLFSDAPVSANHTGAAAVFPHDRAKSDEELVAIAATGGIIGVYAVPFFLVPPGDTATFNHILDSIDYIAKLVGPEHVGIGSDWPFMMTHNHAHMTFGSMLGELGFRPEHRVSTSSTAVGYEDARDFVNFTRGLVSRGYCDEETFGILGGNFLRLFESVCG